MVGPSRTAYAKATSLYIHLLASWGVHDQSHTYRCHCRHRGSRLKLVKDPVDDNRATGVVRHWNLHITLAIVS